MKEKPRKILRGIAWILWGIAIIIVIRAIIISLR
jgi:hypothetical protein